MCGVRQLPAPSSVNPCIPSVPDQGVVLFVVFSIDVISAGTLGQLGAGLLDWYTDPGARRLWHGEVGAESGDQAASQVTFAAQAQWEWVVVYAPPKYRGRSQSDATRRLSCRHDPTIQYAIQICPSVRRTLVSCWPASISPLEGVATRPAVVVAHLLSTV